MKESEYRMYVLIEDTHNHRVFEWRRGTGNLILGLKVTAAFIEDKLGIPFPTTMFSANGHGKNGDTKNVVMVQPGIGMIIQPDVADLSVIVARLRGSGEIGDGGAASDEPAQT